MAGLLLVALAAATVYNPAAMRMLGLGPLLGDGLRLEDAPGISLATTLAATLAAPACHLLQRFVLAPYDLPYLRIIGYLALTTLAVLLSAQLVASLSKQPPALPLMLINGVVVGIVLLGTDGTGTAWSAVATGFGAGAGFGLVLLLFAGLAPRLGRRAVPASLRGPGIALVTLGMTSLAFAGFAGLAR